MPDPDNPLICETLHRPFIGGRQMMALYENHLVLCVVKKGTFLPDSVFGRDGADHWSTTRGIRRLDILPLHKAESIETHQFEPPNSPLVRIKVGIDERIVKFSLPVLHGAYAARLLAERFPDKVIPSIDSARDRRRMLRWGVALWCLTVNGLIAMVLWQMHALQSVTGPPILTDILIKARRDGGYGHAVTIGIVCAAVLCAIALPVLFIKPNPSRGVAITNCPECGYDVRGQENDRCPECGHGLF